MPPDIADPTQDKVPACPLDSHPTGWVRNFKDLELASNNRMGGECRKQTQEAGTGGRSRYASIGTGVEIGRHRDTQTGTHRQGQTHTDRHRLQALAGTGRHRGGAGRCREQAQADRGQKQKGGTGGSPRPTLHVYLPNLHAALLSVLEVRV